MHQVTSIPTNKRQENKPNRFPGLASLPRRPQPCYYFPEHVRWRSGRYHALLGLPVVPARFLKLGVQVSGRRHFTNYAIRISRSKRYHSRLPLYLRNQWEYKLWIHHWTISPSRLSFLQQTVSTGALKDSSILMHFHFRPKTNIT
jgi:hypothetical protein